MSELKIYGCSDDLIEIEGDLREEFGCYNTSREKPFYLLFGDGTVLRVWYDEDGAWRILRTVAGSAKYEHEPAADPDGDYTDKATLKGEIKWAFGVRGGEFHRVKETP